VGGLLMKVQNCFIFWGLYFFPIPYWSSSKWDS